MNILLVFTIAFLRAYKIFLAIIAYLFLSSSALACPKKIPEGLTGTSVGKNLNANGLTMDIVQVESREAAKDIIQRTEKTWKDEGYKVKRNSAAGWEIVSAMGEKCLVTLQLSSRNGAFGYLSRGAPGKLTVATPASMGAPVPGDAKVTSSVISDDDGRKGLVMSMESSRAPDDLLAFFIQQLKENKWGAIRPTVLKGKNLETKSILITAQRSRTQIDIVIWREADTQMMITISEII